jgi:hypothetical protein
MDDKLEKIKAHVAACTLCSAANGRVNDFCREGELLFLDYAQGRIPISIQSVEIPKEQYGRLVEQTERRRRQSERN